MDFGILGPILSFVGNERTNQANIGMAREADSRTLEMQREAQDFNRAETDKNRQWQTQMSNTAFQRATADMKQAGLNPILAGMNQSGASSPSGGAASISGGRGTSATLTDSLGKGVATAIELKSLAQALRGQDSQIALNDALGKKATADAITGAANARQANVNAKATELQLDAIKAKAGFDTEKTKYDRDLIKYDAIMNRAAREAGTVGNAGSLLRFFNNKTSIPKGKGLWDLNTGEIHLPKGH